MHGRPQVKEILIARKLQRWSAIAKCPLIDLRCPPARARKNYQRLSYRHRELAERIGCTNGRRFSESFECTPTLPVQITRRGFE